MIHEVDDQLRYEATKYHLRFSCHDCAWFDGISMRCSHDYPNEPHMTQQLISVVHVTFCKEFELA